MSDSLVGCLKRSKYERSLSHSPMSAFSFNSRPFLTQEQKPYIYINIPSCYHMPEVWPCNSSGRNPITLDMLCGSPVPFSSFHLRWLFLGEFFPNGVWAIICHVPQSVSEMGWQGPLGIGHCATWTTNTSAYIMAGSGKRAGTWGKARYSQEICERERKLNEILQPRGKRCINHDNTLGRHPPLHQWKATASQRGEGSSQCCWIYEADVAWGVLGGRAWASCAGSPAYFPWNHPWRSHKTFKTVSPGKWTAPWRDAFVIEDLIFAQKCETHWPSGKTTKEDNMGK